MRMLVARSGTTSARGAFRQNIKFLILLGCAWCLLGLSRFFIKMTSFKRLANLLGSSAALAPCTPLLSQVQEGRARMIRKAILIASRHTPWLSNCFPQAIAARMLYGSLAIPYALYLGVTRDACGGRLRAHAWVVSGHIYIGGRTSFATYAPIACFTSAKRYSHSPASTLP